MVPGVLVLYDMLSKMKLIFSQVILLEASRIYPGSVCVRASEWYNLVVTGLAIELFLPVWYCRIPSLNVSPA